MTENLCIIPARGGSKRLPRKNIMKFLGEPIIARPIRAAMESECFSEIIVSSDDQEILNYAHEMGCHAIWRPARLCCDDVPETEVYKHILSELTTKPEYFCAIYPTAAFLKPVDIYQGLRMLETSGADACMGVSRFDGPHPFQTMVYDGTFLKLMFPVENEYPRYPVAVASNGSMYFFRTESFLQNPTYYPNKLVGIITESVDINVLEDFKKAEEKARAEK